MRTVLLVVARALVLAVSALSVQAADVASLIRAGNAPELARVLVKTPIDRVSPRSQGVMLGNALATRRADVVDVLLDWGIDANLPIESTLDGETVRAAPVNVAISVNAGWPVVQVLLTHGARVDADADADGMPPLLFALSMGRYDIASGLLDAGVNPRVRVDGDGATALMDVVVSARGAQLDEGLVLARRLKDAGVDVNASTRAGGTALRLAVAVGEARMVRWLIEAGANVNGRDAKGVSVLQLAQRKGKPELIDALRAAGAAP